LGPTWIEGWDRRDYLRAFLFDGDRLQEDPWQIGGLASESIGGITLSANGSAPGRGIVWATTAAEKPDQAIVHGTLRAYDALNIQNKLWNSDLVPEQDSLGHFTKFASPVVANGKVYVVTQSHQLEVYGLLNRACDVNQDGLVNVVDVQLVVDQILGQLPPASDINGDGQVNTIDLQMVVNATLGRGCSAAGHERAPRVRGSSLSSVLAFSPIRGYTRLAAMIRNQRCLA
jgi:hypothetical protein